MKKSDNLLYTIIFLFFSIVTIFSIVAGGICLILLFIKHFSVAFPYVVAALVFISLWIFICKNKIAEIKAEEKKDKEKARKKAAEKERKKQEEMIEAYNMEMKKIQFQNKPKFLTEEQKQQLFELVCDASSYLRTHYLVENVKFPTPTQLTQEELYTLIFINKDIVPIEATINDSTVFDMGVAIDENNNIVIKNENLLTEYVRPEEPAPPVVKKKKTSSKAKKLKKQRKLAARAKANGTQIRNGKEYQPKNYDFLAKEWIGSNMGYINKLLQDAIQKNPEVKKYEVTIPKDKLPEDHETWKLIGKKLREDDEISRYIVATDNIKLIVTAE